MAFRDVLSEIRIQCQQPLAEITEPGVANALLFTKIALARISYAGEWALLSKALPVTLCERSRGQQPFHRGAETEL